MASLRFFAGCKPGMKRKLTDTELNTKKKMYEKSRPDRTFNHKWKEGRVWLNHDENRQVMTCTYCVAFYSDAKSGESQSTSNKFVSGCTNFRSSSVCDHEKSKAHCRAEQFEINKRHTKQQKLNSEAGNALKKMKASERHRLAHLFRNAHGIAKHNRPLTDFAWLCELDKAKSVDVGVTYQNDQAAAEFIHSISMSECKKTQDLLNKSAVFSFQMDGSTDISGDEQEAIYVRTAVKGDIKERFLNISSPNSTKSEDLYNHVLDVFHKHEIDEGKLVAMGSDGASNMTGVRSGLATLLRDRINPEMVNVHCLCHRLELAFRDVVKKVPLYDKLMTLLIGLYYFYKKSYKNKQGLKSAIQAMGKGVFPTKVTGTRWMPHLVRGIAAMLKTFSALEAHLATASHGNPKAEGLHKLLLNKDLMAFALFVQDSLEPAVRLSLKLQKPEVILSDSLCWVESTIELLQEKKERSCEAVKHLLETGTVEGVTLKGATPSMKYADKLLQGFCDSITARFDTGSKNILRATKVLNFGCWPLSGSSDLTDYGNEEVKQVFGHFSHTLRKVVPGLTIDTVLSEWSFLKKIVTKKYGEMTALKWSTVFRENKDLGNISQLVDLMLTIPSTSVRCETAFSQMKLVKTCRRARLGQKVLNDLMVVKLESPTISEFDPESSIDDWLAESVMGRRPCYSRPPRKPETTAGQSEAEAEADIISVSDDQAPCRENPCNSKTDPPQLQTQEPLPYHGLETELFAQCDTDLNDVVEEECWDFQDEVFNFEKLMIFAMEE